MTPVESMGGMPITGSQVTEAMRRRRINERAALESIDVGPKEMTRIRRQRQRALLESFGPGSLAREQMARRYASMAAATIAQEQYKLAEADEPDWSKIEEIANYRADAERKEDYEPAPAARAGFTVSKKIALWTAAGITIVATMVFICPPLLTFGIWCLWMAITVHHDEGKPRKPRALPQAWICSAHGFTTGKCCCYRADQW